MDDVTGDVRKNWEVSEILSRTPTVCNMLPIRVTRILEPIQNYEGSNPQMYLVTFAVADNYQLRGWVDATNAIMFLDLDSMLMLFNNIVEERLAAFNAGHHWRFKGV